ncbi:class V lanthionine synthetase subunit LxmK [Streptomyces sp. NRRL S-920]|uniref:class V lanthionine synthetase subunit LxmK n=1 Tax=Streptomyces sp. NRRL S-920 TaxID=1463921 RepID=UPI00131D8042|nr:class V lanthionine synthetase subunit LxmK [Streptomyces sp. NRRL S-920]
MVAQAHTGDAVLSHDTVDIHSMPRQQVVSPHLSAVPEVARVLRRLGLGCLPAGAVESFAGRNDNWAGTTSTGAAVFVKQVADRDPARPGFHRAVSFERFIARTPVPGLLAPRCVGWDEPSGLQVFAWLRGTRSGAELIADRAFAEVHAHQVGRAIGALHGAGFDERDGIDRTPPPLPSVELLRALPLRHFLEATAAELAFWQLLQPDRQLVDALAALREAEAAAEPRPVHGDLRLDQLLVDGDAVFVTDWEEFRLGDPARDVGGFVGDWLSYAVRGITAVDDADTTALSDHDIIARGTAELTRVRSLLRSFWAGYRQARPVRDPQLELRATAFAGWHMFDRLLATSQRSPRLSAVQRAGAGVGRNAVLAPQRFAGVLGLDVTV